MYTSFIRPILEYGSVIWGNCSLHEKELLDKIHNEVAKIATGATKLVSLTALYSETGWESLEKRRRKQRLLQLYKMSHNLAPQYLSSLLPVREMSRYNLRNVDDIQSPYARTNLYFNSFLPCAIREWNELPVEVRQLDSISSFKHYLNRDNITIPQYYYVGNRKSQVLLTRLRTGCSALNSYLFSKNLVESPLCRCGQHEDTKHFLLHCPLYDDQRIELLDTVSQICLPSLNTLLSGDISLSIETNSIILRAVQKYINKSQRFKS